MEVIADQAVALFRSFREEKRQRTNAEDWQKQAENNQHGQDHWEAEYNAALKVIGEQAIVLSRQAAEIERLDGYHEVLTARVSDLSDEAQAIEGDVIQLTIGGVRRIKIWTGAVSNDLNDDRNWADQEKAFREYHESRMPMAPTEQAEPGNDTASPDDFPEDTFHEDAPEEEPPPPPISDNPEDHF